MRDLLEILSACGTEQAVLPATALYSEAWLLRLALAALARAPGLPAPLAPALRARWFCEGLLPSPFPPRHRGDRLAEGWLRADAVVGHFSVSGRGRPELAAQDECRQLVVLSVKLGAPLARGSARAPRYNEAARSVACMAELLWRAKQWPGDLDAVGFYVLAPARQVGSVVQPSLLTRASLRAVVESRVRMYRGEPEYRARCAWFEQACAPLLAVLDVGVIPWEQVWGWLRELSPRAGAELGAFYERCLAHHPLRLASAARGT